MVLKEAMSRLMSSMFATRRYTVMMMGVIQRPTWQGAWCYPKKYREEF